MEGKNVTITIAEFYAFGRKYEKPYVDKDDEYINEDLNNIANTGRLISLTKYVATHQETKNFTVSQLIIEEVSSVVEEYTKKEVEEEQAQNTIKEELAKEELEGQNPKEE